MTRRTPAAEHWWRVNSLWLVPMLCILAGAVSVTVLLLIDAAVGYDMVPTSALGTPSAVQTVLSTAASAMLTLTTVVLTVMTLGVQLAMQQFSPRIVRALLADRRSQLAHGLFAATFLFCMVATVEVDDQAKPGGQVPSITVATAYLLLLASLLTLVVYVHVAGQALRVAGLIDLVGDNLHREIERLFPLRYEPDGQRSVVTAPDAGVVVVIDVDGLVELAARREDRIELLVAMGDFVPRGGQLARCRRGGATDEDSIRGLVLLDNERSHVTDAAYGLRKLVDIAGRSVASSPHNDPMTAVQAIDRLHDAVRQLCLRRLPDGVHRDAHGEVRLLTREVSWSGYVAIAFEELVEIGGSTPLVARRLLAALEDLLSVAPADRRPALDRQRSRLLAHAGDRGSAVVADPQGMGAADDLLVTPARTT